MKLSEENRSYFLQSLFSSALRFLMKQNNHLGKNNKRIEL